MTSKVTDEVLNIAEYGVETGAESNKSYEIKNQPRGSFSFSPYNRFDYILHPTAAIYRYLEI